MSDHPGLPGGRPGAAHRDHHQRHPRLPDRETADQSARAAGDRPLGQPAPAGRPTTQPQPDPSRGRLHRRAPTDHHRHRTAHRRVTCRRSPGTRAAASVARVPATPERFPQPRPAQLVVRAARPIHDHHRADELRPTTAPRTRADHPYPAQPPLPAHRDRTPSRHAAQPHPHPAAAARPRPTRRSRSTRAQPAAQRRTRLPTSSRSTHPRSRPRRMITKT
jgi:hypothetical protein